MSKLTKLLAAISSALLLGNGAFAQETTADTVVTTVNGTAITIGHMIVLREALPEQYQTLPDDVLFNGILEQLVQQTVLAQQVNEIDPLIDLRLENERRSLLAASTIQGFANDAVTDEAIKMAYDERFADQEPTREFNASHILVETEDEAKALITELEAGADFAELAKEKSTGPSGPNGGELGWFGPGMMVKPFEDAVLTLAAGEVSAPVETQFGWHVIVLNDVRTQNAPPIDSVRAELAQQLQRDALEKVVQDLVSGADIVETDVSSIDQSAIRDITLVQ